MRRLRFAALATAIVLALWSIPATAEARTISRSQFIARADQICVRGAKAIAKFEPKFASLDPFAHPSERAEASTLIREGAGLREGLKSVPEQGFCA